MREGSPYNPKQVEFIRACGDFLQQGDVLPEPLRQIVERELGISGQETVDTTPPTSE